MGRKRRNKDRDSSDRLLRRIEKLEEKLRKRRRRSPSYSSSSKSSISRSRSQSPEKARAYHYEKEKNDLTDSVALEESLVSDPGSPDGQSRQRTASDDASQGPSTLVTLCDESAAPQLLPANRATNDENTNEHLDDVILSILGDAPKDKSPTGKDIHCDIATRLQDILVNGLKKESKEKITEEYHIPGNCQLFKAPILNPEVKAAVSDLLQKKDSSLAARQGQVAIALTALTRPMEILKSDKSETSQTILKHISNASRLLCDSHYLDTKMRRNFLISTLNNKLKDTLKESKRDTFLFGEVLPEKLKASKAITKSSQDLRSYKPKSVVTKTVLPFTANNLNWKHPQPNPPNTQRKAIASTQCRTAGPSTSRRSEAMPKAMSSRVNKTNAQYRPIKKY